MDSKNNYKAEDFLSENIPKGKVHLMSDSERELAEDIKSVVKGVGKERLSSLETAELWERIQHKTLSSTKTVNWRLYVQIAAVLLILLSIGLWQYQRNTPTQKLLAFAAQNIGKKNIDSGELHSIPNGSASSQSAKENKEENIITANDFNTLVVGDGQRSVIKLPDGTKVWLNSSSKLIYPIAFSGKIREVYLEGEAYFDVAHDKTHPFYVRAKNMDIKVLGTEFYVSADADSISNYAILVKGSIAFSMGNWLNKVEGKLEPGERINYNPEEKKFSISPVKTEEFQSWKEGFLNVNSESLDIIIQRVAKYYHIEINIEGLDLSSERFSGRLDFQHSVTDVLDILCIGSPYVYNSRERRLELKKR